jgi:NADPH-dependent curcumin reductase CurA
MISQYNKPATEQYAVKGLTSIVSKRLKVEGFVVTDPSFFIYREERDEKMIQVGKSLREGARPTDSFAVAQRRQDQKSRTCHCRD